MDTRFRFTPEDIDEISGMPTIHFSYIIQNMIPLSIASSQRIKAFDLEFEDNKEVSVLNDDDVTAIPVGSMAEGLNMPNFTETTKEGSKSLALSDIDIMLVMNQYLITFDGKEKLNLKFVEAKELLPWDYFALAETNDIHSGYVRINRSNTVLFDQYQDREMLLLNFRMYSMQKKELIDKIEVNGPALTIPKSVSDRQINGNPLPMDKVLAMPCKEWPPLATPWIQRSIERGWLPETLIQEIVKAGCHIVPTHHRKVDDWKSRDEWRISFATAERQIAREALTDFQKQAYVAIKILYHQRLKKLELLSSYHLKTVFFYTCEQIPSSCWEENMGSCILCFLDILIKYVKEGNIPNFFISENNLIDYLSKEQINALLEALTEIRKNPVEQLLLFFDDKFIENIGVKLEFRRILNPIVVDIETYFKHPSIIKSLKEVLKPCSLKMMLGYMERTKYKEALRTGEELYSLMLKYEMAEETLAEFFLTTIPQITTDQEMVINFFTYITKFYEKEKNFECCRNYLLHLSETKETGVREIDWKNCWFL